MAKDYDGKRSAAEHMYVNERKTAREIADTLDIAQKTVGEWVKKYLWKEKREAKVLAPRKRTENVERIISGMAEKRLLLDARIEEEENSPAPDQEKIESCRREIAAIDYGVANWNKSLANIRKDGQVSLTQYLQIMEDIFKALCAFDYPLYLKTIDFQEHHVNDLSSRKP